MDEGNHIVYGVNLIFPLHQHDPADLHFDSKKVCHVLHLFLSMHQSVDMKPFVKDTGQNSVTMLMGIGLTLAANVLHLAASYLIKIKHLSPTDHLLSRAFTQTLTFGLWSFLSAIFSGHLRYQGKKHSHLKTQL